MTDIFVVTQIHLDLYFEVIYSPLKIGDTIVFLFYIFISFFIFFCSVTFRYCNVTSNVTINSLSAWSIPEKIKTAYLQKLTQFYFKSSILLCFNERKTSFVIINAVLIGKTRIFITFPNKVGKIHLLGNISVSYFLLCENFRSAKYFALLFLSTQNLI